MAPGLSLLTRCKLLLSAALGEINPRSTLIHHSSVGWVIFSLLGLVWEYLDFTMAVGFLIPLDHQE